MDPALTIYTISFNEELILEFMIRHYRSRFPACQIVVFDNESTDRTAAIAQDNGCIVIPHKTNGKFYDSGQIRVKNNCWKSATTDWVLVCDTDELLDIDEHELRRIESSTTIVRSIGYNMINMRDDYDLDSMTHGSQCHLYSKNYLFNRIAISEINYGAGAHASHPIGDVRPSAVAYPAYHYRCIHPERTFEKIQQIRARLSDENICKGWGTQYMRDVSLKRIRSQYATERAAATVVRVAR